MPLDVPPKRFKKGQQIVCVFRGPWEDAKGNKYGYMPGILPAFNEVYTVEEHLSCDAKGWYIVLQETNNEYAYHEYHFRALVDDAVLAEELQSIFQLTLI